MSYYDEEDGVYYNTWEDGHYIHQRKPFEGHYPAKDEAKVLRRLMSQTGLNEAQVRSIKKYRIMLAETQKPKGSSYGMSVRCQRFFKGIVKMATKATKLAKQHPRTLEKIDKLLREHNYGRHANCEFCNYYLAQLKKDN